MDNSILTQSLDELEGDRWLDPDHTASRLIQEAHRLRSIPIGRMTTEDLRLLLGQRIGTEWLMPLALERLRREPLAQGDFYPGDLLVGVLRTDTAYWSTHPDELQALNEVRLGLMVMRDVPDELLADANWPAFG